MKVKLEKAGGIAGGMQFPDLVVDSGSLPTLKSDELTKLVEAARAEPAPHDDGRARDSMKFKITVDQDDGDSTVMEQGDTGMSGSFAKLLDFLERVTED